MYARLDTHFQYSQNALAFIGKAEQAGEEQLL